MSAGRRTSVFVAVAVTLVGAVSLVLAGPDPPIVELRAIPVPAAPGSAETLALDTALYLPRSAAVDAPVPAVLVAHGFLGDRRAVDGFARDLTAEGYAVLTWSARGFGRSEGSISLADPAREVADITELIEELATRDEVMQDGPGDPRVAIVGASYGGGTALQAAVAEPRLDAVVAIAAWHRLADALAPDGRVDAGPGILAAGWTSLLFTSSTLQSAFGAGGRVGPDAPDDRGAGGAPGPPPATCGRFTTELCDLYSEAAVAGTLTPDGAARLDRASPAGRLGTVTAPTLLVQGQQDTLFGLAASRRNAAEIAASGTPVRLRWVPGGHETVGGGVPTGVVRGEAVAWLERWLAATGPSAGSDASGTSGASGDETSRAGALPPVVPFTWTDQAADRPRDRQWLPGGDPLESADASTLRAMVSADGRLVVAADDRPPTGGPAVAGRRSLVSPPGGRPAALSTLPGVGGVGGLAGLLPSADIPGQHVSFTTEPFAEAMTLLGPPSLRLTVDADTDEARVFVKLHDVAPDGSATLLQAAVTPVRVTDPPATLDLALADVAHRLARDHRLRLTIAATDQAFANLTRPTTVHLALDPATSLLRLPTVSPGPGGGGGSFGGRPGAVASIVLVAAIGVVLARRWRPGGLDAVTVGHAPPIEIRGLTKRYADGNLAVDDLDLTVEAGQVVGLLGPNGAGKTSTLRMLVGLVAADAGTIRIFGHDLRPGHPVLHHVGVLVEGPGFSPELSGRANLELYWRAGGRTLAEADLPWALGVAELGDAIDKPVRTYSHGMKQRLAVAQALLGRPSLLVLDEPTDGLDPEQIRSMRELLARLGDEGHTVLVSSHLLAEVEQMCTHVVVVQRGQLRAAGPVADLVGTTQTVVIRTEDRLAARAVLRDHVPDSDIEVSGAGLAVTLGTHEAADLVGWLVAAGQRVQAVTPRGTLEDAFLSLTGDRT